MMMTDDKYQLYGIIHCVYGEVILFAQNNDLHVFCQYVTQSGRGIAWLSLVAWAAWAAVDMVGLYVAS